MIFTKIGAGLDMRGCPNRCRHCWLGVTPNRNLTTDDLHFVADQFRPFTDHLDVWDHYREPDYADNYRQMWDISSSLSAHVEPHFELISYWRAVRDESYIPWVYSMGVRAAQLTIFGDEEMTDYFVGRKGAYHDILKTIEILLANRIAPRIQFFVYKKNIDQLVYIQQLIEDLRLEERCAIFEKPFAFFLHQGSCGGENEQFYDQWITPEDVVKIPPKLLEHTLKHFGKSDIFEVLGEPEQALHNRLSIETATMKSIVTDTPWFFVDGDFNVYPNYETPSHLWCLGNLKTDGAGAILDKYLGEQSPAQRTMTTVPIGEMVKAVGDPNSQRLMTEWDYMNFILTKYCRL